MLVIEIDATIDTVGVSDLGDGNTVDLGDLLG